MLVVETEAGIYFSGDFIRTDLVTQNIRLPRSYNINVSKQILLVVCISQQLLYLLQKVTEVVASSPGFSLLPQ